MKTIETSPWAVSAENYPVDGSVAQQWEFVLQYAVLAPSSYNTQPWIFRQRRAAMDVCADRRRSRPVADPEDRELTMSCGCALFHLRCAMRHFGCLGPVQVFPDADLDVIARVHRGTQGETRPEQRELFEAITTRRTNRRLFSDDLLPSGFYSTVQAAAESEGAWLKVIEEEPLRLALAELIAEADRRRWTDPAFRSELSRWVHPNPSASQDGIPGFALGVDDLLSCTGPLTLRTTDLVEGEAAHDSELALSSPALMVLGTNSDNPRDWVAGGQALAHLLLRAAATEVRASFLGQPVQIPELRKKLAALIGTTGFPQVVLRLGFGDNVRPTPRRAVREVLV